MLHTRDPLVERRVAGVAARFDATALQVLGREPDPLPPLALVIQVDLDGALETLAAWRAAHARLIMVAYVSTPDVAAWKAAERAGADVVTSRGRADRELAARLDDQLSGRRQARRMRLASYRDFAGRLGFVGQIEDTPVGTVSIFHLANKLHAIADGCPHAGTSLCGGELEGDVITCPAHGSQFRVTDGERLRGPADSELRTFPISVEAGEVFLELPEVP